MRVKRVQVEEGFLDGIDVSFASGLNVIIGARGTGKTSLIELLRFCLGVQGYTSESRKRSLDHALSILGSGQVTVTLTDGERNFFVTRTADDESPRASGPFARPIIFSQTEIENIGLRAQGRVRLLDSFHSGLSTWESHESEACSEVRSLTAEVEEQRREIDKLEELLVGLPALDKQIAELVPQEQEVTKISSEAKKKKNELDAISARIAASAVSVGAIERFVESVSRWQSSLASRSSTQRVFEAWPEGAGPDLLKKGRASLERAKQHLETTFREMDNALSEAKLHLRSARDRKLRIEADARRLRKEVESLLQGAGAIVRQGQQLRERKAQLESLKKILKQRREALKACLARRDDSLDRLDSIREQRFRKRRSVATELTDTLGPRIRVKTSRAGQFGAYAAALADALRGSGLRYNDLSWAIAKNVSPRELLEVVDQNDFDLLAEATSITKDRAARVVGRLRECDLGALATVIVEDTVALQLLDGADYKSIGELSTGQRCTVVLPLVLRHMERVLIVDQPEDHIDNAFIADTLIISILARGADGQIIFSTHNANIPVLGNADHVIQLGSDGRRGFPILSSNLDDPSVVNAITTVMEGGSEAFKKRATFYGRHETS